MNSRPLGRFASRSLALLVLAMGAAGASCSSGSNGNPGTGGSTGTGGSSSTGGATGSGGTSSSGGTTGTGGASATGGATGSGGTVATGGATGTGGTTGSGGSTGTGGASATGGATGSGGTSATGGATGTGGAAGSGTTGCPSNATFCSGFETAGQPAGSVYMVNAAPGDWSRDFTIDTSQHHAGNSSLLVKNQSASGSSGSQYRMLAVPVPTGGTFWVRFWVESDIVMGGSNPHNAFAGPSPTSNPNDPLDSFAEDVGISFHTLDSDVTWPTGYGRLPGSGSTNPYTLPAMTWACVEISYDLTNRHQQLYINGTLLIDATNYPPSASYSGAFGMFKFGFDSFNGPTRQMWYDDVVVAPNRVGCP